MSEVVRLFPGLLPVSAGTGCGADHQEFGALCTWCRNKQEPIDDSFFVHHLIAEAIVELRRFQNQSIPLSGAVAAALEKMRQAYDASEPLVKISGRGYVELVGGELWAFPEPNLSFGPFGSEESAQDALTAYQETKRAKEPVT